MRILSRDRGIILSNIMTKVVLQCFLHCPPLGHCLVVLLVLFSKHKIKKSPDTIVRIQSAQKIYVYIYTRICMYRERERLTMHNDAKIILNPLQLKGALLDKNHAAKDKVN